MSPCANEMVRSMPLGSGCAALASLASGSSAALAAALALALALAVALAAARDRRRGALELGEVAAGVAAEVLPRGRRRDEVRAPGGNARGGGDVMTMMMRANG